jgi:hypothetical protein
MLLPGAISAWVRRQINTTVDVKKLRLKLSYEGAYESKPADDRQLPRDQ